MPIIIDYVTPGSGATASYHVVSEVTINYKNKRSSAQIESYVSKDTFDGGKQPVFTQPIEFSEIPTDSMTPIAYAEQKIAAPIDDKTSPTAARSNFIGAQIAD